MAYVVAIIVFGMLAARHDIIGIIRHVSDNRLSRFVESTKQAEFEYETERLRHERTSITSYKE